jgi:hypothetical protein
MKCTRSIDFYFIRYRWQRKMNAAEFVCLFVQGLIGSSVLVASVITPNAAAKT